MRYTLSRRGQNVIEYILLVMVVVIVLIGSVLRGGARKGVEGTGPLVDGTKKVMAGPATLMNHYKSEITF